MLYNASFFDRRKLYDCMEFTNTSLPWWPDGA